MTDVQDLVVRARTAPTRRERVEAFAILVERFRAMACGYAYALLGDAHRAEDVAQEAFVTAFDHLGRLEQPAAFPGWFRRIVWSACGRATRRRTVGTSALAAAAELACPGPAPDERLARQEIQDEVAAALRDLPAPQREVLTLFHLGGHAQREIAIFLGISVATVKNRLNAARRRLRERMLHMVEDTLHRHTPDEGFDRRVVAELLAWPRPLAIEGHPVRRIYGTLRRAVPDHEPVEGDEIVERAGIVNPWTRQFAFPVADDRVLRTETTALTLAALAGRTPPVRVIAAGRAFRDTVEDERRVRVFHQVDLACVEAGAGEDAVKRTLQALLRAVFGEVAVRYEATTLPALSPCWKVEAALPGGWRGVAGCGVLTADFLRQAGHDPARVGGHAIAMELENLAMLAYGIDDVRALWRAPYLC